MTDVCSVVASLKLTPKGKLKYGEELTEVDLLSQFSKLCLSPVTLNNTLNNSINNNNNNNNSNRTRSGSECCDVTVGEKSPERFSNYFSPQKACTAPEESIPGSTNTGTCGKMKVKEDAFNFVKPCQSDTQMSLRTIEEEYRDRSKVQETARLQDYYAQILKLDSDHATQVEHIERSSLMKQSNEAKQINEDQNSASDELAYYQGLREQRESIAAEKLRQAELHRKEIEAKIKRDNDLKQEKLEKKKCLANLAEPGLKIVNDVTRLYIDKEKSNKCEEFKVIVDRVNVEYNHLVNTVNIGLSSNHDIDAKIQEAKGKLNVLVTLQTDAQSLAKHIEDQILAKEAARKEAEEKMKKLAEDEAKAKKAAAAAAASVAAPATPAAPAAAPSATTTTPAVPVAVAAPAKLENELSIAVAAPALLPMESMLKPMLQMFVAKSCFRDYLRLSKLLIDTEKSHEALSKSTDKAKKAYKFELTKVINTAINAISDESPKHLMDKVTKLVTLLSGKEVVHAGKKVSTSGDPCAMALCKDLIAKKLVAQGPTQVASSYKAAFAISAVALGVWASFPEVGELIMAHFYNKCPYTVPFYIPKSNDISTPDYCQLLGYSVNGQDVEAEDKYLKKLSGLIRLYASMISSDIPPAFGSTSHPHGLDHAWCWLTRVLNMQPRPVTATIIFDFLETAGHAMKRRFGGQFRKLLVVLYHDVMPKILEVTPPESKAGAMRLKLFLEECIKQNGSIKPPEGFLSKNWYTTTSSYYR